MKHKTQTRIKLPDDFLGTVAALLHTPPTPKANTAANRKTAKKGAKKR
jgi:hypothetical protein